MAISEIRNGLVYLLDGTATVKNSLDLVLEDAGYSVQRWPSGEDFLNGADRTTPACVLIDIHLPDNDGLQVQEHMVDHGLDFPVIVLTGHGEVAKAVLAMRGGAIDVLERPLDSEHLLRSLAAAFKEVSARVALRETAHWAAMQVGKLTGREREVLDGLACGYPNKTIAHDLGISARTVEVHRANVMAKLGVGNYAEALRLAFRAGLGDEKAWCECHGEGRHRYGTARTALAILHQKSGRASLTVE